MKLLSEIVRQSKNQAGRGKSTKRKTNKRSKNQEQNRGGEVTWGYRTDREIDGGGKTQT